MNKDQKKRQEVTTYKIEESSPIGSGSYKLSKMVLDVEVESYLITFREPTDPTASYEMWCNCPGFARQKFPRLEHKHIRVAQHFANIGGESAEYRFSGVGRSTVITHKGVVI